METSSAMGAMLQAAIGPEPIRDLYAARVVGFRGRFSKERQMGHITTVGNVPKNQIQRYVIVPMQTDALNGEARDFWNRAGIWRVKGDELEEFAYPERTVLYVLAHSGRAVTYIADGEGTTMTAEGLVDYLVSWNLSPRILAVKIWACFTGINGFAQEVKAKFLELNKGYNPIVMGYNEMTGGPFDQGDRQKHVFQDNNGNKGPVMGRASLHRTIF